ncbi:Uncharacterised protein [Segatella copri]|nr:Uncharacterised protein [Segatella copri]
MIASAISGRSWKSSEVLKSDSFTSTAVCQFLSSK